MVLAQAIKTKSTFYLISPALLVMMGILMVIKSPALMIGVLVLLTAATVLVLKPRVALLTGFILIYSNIVVLAYKLYSVPQGLAATASLFFLVPFLVFILIKREKFQIDYLFLLMLLYLAVLLLSAIFAQNLWLALMSIGTYVSEGLLLYLIILNTVRDQQTLKLVITTLLVVGSLLGGMSLYQEVTKAYDQQFGGLALRDIQDYSGPEDLQKANEASPIRKAQRAAGPIGDPNRYAQILLVPLPLAFMRMRSEAVLRRKCTALLAVFLLLSGIILSYSRGAFLAIVILVVFLTVLGYFRVYQLLLTGGLLLIFMVVTSPAYLSRISTIRGVAGLTDQRAEVQPDQVTRGRLTEMLAAANVFLDHPLLGVGPGHFAPYYSINYMSNPEIAFRHLPRSRRAHILYFEMGAEIGLFGLGIFLTLPAIAIYRLLQLRKKFRTSNPAWAHIATGFVLSFIGYLTTALFLHLSYQRYFWLLLGLAGAAIRIFSESTGSVAGEHSESEASV